MSDPGRTALCRAVPRSGRQDVDSDPTWKFDDLPLEPIWKQLLVHFQVDELVTAFASGTVSPLNQEWLADLIQPSAPVPVWFEVTRVSH